MATQLAKKSGRRDKAKVANLLALKVDDGDGLPKHQAAVLLANNSDMNVIEANAAEECPEGKDLLPSRIYPGFLKYTFSMNRQNIARKEQTNPVQASRAASH